MICNKVLVDINVFQDVITKRKDWEGSQKVLKLFDQEDNKGWISSLTKPIIYFLSVKKIGEKNARRLVTDLTCSFSEIPLRQVVNEAAILNDLPEYEDNIQFESAHLFHMDAIITRNKKHYKQEDMPVYSPEEFLDLLEQNGDPTKLTVPFLDLKAQHHQIYNEVDDRITDVITNTAFIMGKYVEEFEEQFAEAQEAKYCIGVSSGTDALHVALLALGIGPGDKVIVPVNTFIATAEAVSLCGAEPVFVDCDRFYNLDVKELRKVIESKQYAVNSKQIEDRSQRSEVRGHPGEMRSAVVNEFHRAGRAEGSEQGEIVSSKEYGVRRKRADNDSRITCIIPVHLYGQPADMDGIMELAEDYGLKVVEDCCQAHLARYRDRPVGNFGDIGAFSFFPGKNLGAYGEAGAIVTNDNELYKKMRLIHNHGSDVKYRHNVIGHNYRMEAFQGAVLSSKLAYLEEWTQKRRANAGLYNEMLADVAGLQTPEELDNTFCVYHLYMIQVDDRDGLQRYLQENGISTGLHYPVPLHTQRAYESLGYKEGDFPVAGAAAKRILSLPMYPELTKGQISYVCEKIKKYY